MMMTRRDAVASLALFAELMVSSREADAQTPGAAQVTAVFTHALPDISLKDWDVTVSHVDYGPGGGGPAHHHAGFVLAYVVEGAVVSKVSGQGTEATFTRGQMFYEQPGATHEVSRNASQTQPARLLALIFAPKGATLTAPGAAPAGAAR
jgi:quercetin dioxygenase-like cupin family protein